MVEKLYRYESERHSVCIDPEMELFGVSGARLVCKEYSVVAETPKGYWISLFWPNNKDKWVSNCSRKRFAHPTKEEALKAYEHRKKSYVRHAKAQLKRAEEDLRLVNSFTAKQVTG